MIWLHRLCSLATMQYFSGSQSFLFQAKNFSIT
ncbi:hypothetical protein POPTR_005G211200v4 [Populus trichocarpa]|uniref:Uncharacterized protein n=1 Tax=Populus trichocarpa TaxID=3694 RepID=A0ACC0T179_POPTR|nr:hypothetical protein BDE02_05G177600 [Populus trichocarpa]KAI9395290.1 hypothetical protein POPTR_005G211200v4 [Populus trichocarpa]